jgi:hypothetical protein
MKTTLALLIASTALTAAIAWPAWSAIQDRAADETRPIAALLEAGPDAQPVILASNDDDDDDDDNDNRRRSERNNDDDDDDDDDNRGARTPNPAPAGTVAPPANGLFGNGAPPKVQMN